MIAGIFGGNAIDDGRGTVGRMGIDCPTAHLGACTRLMGSQSSCSALLRPLRYARPTVWFCNRLGYDLGVGGVNS